MSSGAFALPLAPADGPRAGALRAGVRNANEVTVPQAAEMFALYEAYYAAGDFDTFRRDLAAKTHVIELRAAGWLRGFSTAQVIDFEFQGAREQAIFSGDTIIDSAFWGEQALVHAFCRLAGEVKAANAGAPLYWFLISKGHRTYRYLGAFAHDYHPHHARPSTAGIRERLDRLASAKFGCSYDPATGVIRFPRSMGHLRRQWADIPGHLRAHPAVAFFLGRNPGYPHGDELACMAELRPDNLRSFARRAFLEGLHGRARDEG